MLVWDVQRWLSVHLPILDPAIGMSTPDPVRTGGADMTGPATSMHTLAPDTSPYSHPSPTCAEDRIPSIYCTILFMSCKSFQKERRPKLCRVAVVVYIASTGA